MPVTAVESWVGKVSSTMSTLPSRLEQAAPRGTFGSVLEQAVALLDAGPAPTAAPAPTAVPAPTAAPAATASVLPGDVGAQAGAVQTGSTANGSAAVSEAERFLGVPYVWGGSTPSGFDCSGLVQYVYSQLGISLPRTTYTQVESGAPVASLGQAQPGDLVFFAGSDGTPTAPGHVGIYIGGGKMIDAPYTGTIVQVQTVSSAGPVVAIRRVLPSTTSSGSLDVPSKFAPLFLAAGARYGVSPTLLAAVARQESGFSPDAVSTAGAQGMMQLMPATAAGLGVTPLTPSQAIDGAARLLSGYIHQFGSVPLALAAYNAGSSAVEEYGGIPPYSETQHYVASIMSTLEGAS